MKPSTEKKRYFVPDLAPHDREALEGAKPRAIFVAESPHNFEVEPDALPSRRPLCGPAGRVWWGMLSELLEGNRDEDVSLERLIDFCRKHRVAVMNAVQYPLDPKITKRFPKADPETLLGFSKAAGPSSYKKMKNSPVVQDAIHELRERLTAPEVAKLPIHCLGNDAEWFVTQALTPEEREARVGAKIPHPSAWWRRGGLFGQIAREKLETIAAEELNTSGGGGPASLRQASGAEKSRAPRRSKEAQA